MAPDNSNGQVYGPGAPAPMAPGPKKVYSIWWPMSFLILWLVFCATGGGLIGGAFNQGTISYCYEPGACDDGPDDGMLIAGYVFVSLGGVSATVFWILLIIWLVKRSSARSQHPNVYYVNPPMAAQGGMAYPPQGWQQQPYMQPQHQPQYYPQHPPQPQPVSAAPMQHQVDPSSQAARQMSPNNLTSPTQAPPLSDSVPHSQDKKTCSSCGTPVTTPFCSQCGVRNG